MIRCIFPERDVARLRAEAHQEWLRARGDRGPTSAAERRKARREAKRVA